MAAPWETERSKNSQVPTLPPISTHRGALVPYNGDRLEHLETRLKIVEQSHKMLLEELVNAQSQSWVSYKEKESQKEIRNFIEQNITQLSELVRSNMKQLEVFERKMEHFSSSLVQSDNSHSLCIAKQQNLETRISDLHEILTNLQEQLSQHFKKSELMTMTLEGGGGIVELENGMKLLKDDQKEMAVSIARLDGHIEVMQLQNRKLFETRSDETWSALSELRSQLVNIEMYKKKQDHWLKQSFEEINNQLLELTHKLSETANGVSSHMKKVESASMEKHAELVGHILEELNEREKEWNHEREQKENELKQQLNELEKSLREQQLCQHSNRLASLEKHLEIAREDFEHSQKQIKKSLSTLTESMSLIEKETLVNKKDITSVIRAEIKTRREEILNMKKDFVALQEGCHKSHQLLQNIVYQNNTSTHEAMIQSHQKCQDSNKLLLADIGSRLSSLHKQLNINPPHRDDSEIRASALRTEIQLLSEQFEQHERKLDELEDLISKKTKEDIQEIYERLTETNECIYQLENNIQELQTGQLQQICQLNQDIDQVKNDINWLQATSLEGPLYADHARQNQIATDVIGGEYDMEFRQLPFPSQNTINKDDSTEQKDSPTPEPRSFHSSPLGNQKVDNIRSGQCIQSSCEPLETMGTFTSVPSTPDDQRNILRSDGVNASGGDNSNVFIKFDDNGQMGSSWLNRWGLYQAVRLLQIKEKLMKPVNIMRDKRKKN